MLVAERPVPVFPAPVVDRGHGEEASRGGGHEDGGGHGGGGREGPRAVACLVIDEDALQALVKGGA